MTNPAGEPTFEYWIGDEIRQVVRDHPDNRLKRLDGKPIFDTPLVGFVSGSDPIFLQLKQVIGEFHLTPEQVMARVADRTGAEATPAHALGVIAYVLPIAEETRRENARAKEHPSERWANTRLFGEAFNAALQVHLVQLLERKGYRAVAPERDADLFRTFVDDRVGWTSVWSQRHIAFAAGLGTFGLSDGLITAVGKAHRIGSLVVNQPVASSTRPVDIHRDCLFYRDVSCQACKKRCPVDAISDAGHDKQRCAQFVLQQVPYIKEHYGIEIFSCGLCQTNVPCAKRIPKSAQGF